MRNHDIRLEPRCWTGDELDRHDDQSGRLEIVRGRLCLNEEQRLLLLCALLEHVGTARAVQMGPLKALATAIAEREALEAWDNMPAVVREQFWRPAMHVPASHDQRCHFKVNAQSSVVNGGQRP